MKALLHLGCVVLLTSCASIVSVSDNEACVVKLDVPEKMTNCFGIYDVVYRYKNPPRPIGKVLYHTLYNASIPTNYAGQERRYHCYAAALQSTFSTLGWKYPQARFANAISEECFGIRDAPLTFSQIVFAATSVHAPPGVWYAELPNGAMASRMSAIAGQRGSPPGLHAPADASRIPGQSGPLARRTFPIATMVARCQGARGGTASVWAQMNVDPVAVLGTAMNKPSWSENPMLMIPAPMPPHSYLEPPSEHADIDRLDLYSPTTWRYRDSPPDKVDGGIVPVRDSTHLIDVFFEGWPVVAGLGRGTGGHVVLIQKMHIAVVETGPKTVGRHPFGFVDWVEVSDPENPLRPNRIVSGDDFLADARFLFAVYQLKKSR